jgi:secreted trypsin-like serine protease
LTPRIVLTAAHCIYAFQGNILKGDMYVSVGKFALQPDEGPIQVRAYDFPRESGSGFSYNPTDYSDDIGLLFLVRPFKSVATFPKLHFGSPDWKLIKEDQQSLVVIGYGRLKDKDGFLTEEGVKRYASIRASDFNNRSMFYSFSAMSAGACAGDSGGGTYISQTNLLAAVTSRGARDCTGTGAQTRVDAYRAWLLPRLSG